MKYLGLMAVVVAAFLAVLVGVKYAREESGNESAKTNVEKVKANTPWVMAGHNQKENYTGYADATTIHKEGNRVKMWSLIDYKMPASAGDKQFMSMKVQSEYDCMNEQLRVLYLSGYSGDMGRGELVYGVSDPGNWVPASSESVNLALWKFACGKG